MPNYIPTPLPDAEEHLRYHQCFLSRPYGDDAGQPQVNFREEHIIQNVAGKQTEPAGEVNLSITDVNEDEEFDMINPGTLQPTGDTMSYAQVIQALDSLYYHLAVIRDATPHPVP